jgi:glutathione S-transferase
MSGFVVHSIPGSPFGRAVLATLEEKGVPYRLAAIAPGTLRGPQHLARHAFGRVPVLDHDDFSLYETQAILRYVDRVVAEPALTPADARAAGRMDQLMNINDWYLFQGVANVIAFQRVVGPRLFGLTPDEAAIAAAVPKGRMVFGELARHLGDRPYFAGDAVSLADLLIAPQLDFLRDTPEWPALVAGDGALPRWLERMRARPSLVATTWERVAALAGAGEASAARSHASG